MKKICFVVQRYGEQILGGSESYCRQIAERLTDFYDVEVLTTKALSYVDWGNDIEGDIEIVNNVTVHRFQTDHPRSLSDEIIEKAYKYPADIESGVKWLEAQGPYCPNLITYLTEHKDEYNAVVLMTYLYYPVPMAARIAGEKAVLIPTAHDEPWIHQPVYDELFANSKAWYFLTPEEKHYVESLFPTDGKVLGTGNGGVGVEKPQDIDTTAFREKHGLGDKPYLVYAGRIDDSKFCPELFNYFREYKTRNDNDLQLVLCGKGDEVPSHPDIHPLGFVSEEEKFAAMSSAVALCLPSRFESLSIVVLEAMSVQTPVIVTEKCEVLKGHCQRSNAGLYYQNYLEFEAEVNLLLNCAEMRSSMGRNGEMYVQSRYQWDVIMNGLRDIIESVAV